MDFFRWTLLIYVMMFLSTVLYQTKFKLLFHGPVFLNLRICSIDNLYSAVCILRVVNNLKILRQQWSRSRKSFLSKIGSKLKFVSFYQRKGLLPFLSKDPLSSRVVLNSIFCSFAVSIHPTFCLLLFTYIFIIL